MVLNGIGGAMAGVLAALPTAPMASHAMADMHPEPQAHDCHDQVAAAHGGQGQEPPGPVPDCHFSDAGECGGRARGRRACMATAAAVPYLPAVGMIQAHAAALVPPLAVGHPAPPLPSPIRPPIA